MAQKKYDYNDGSVSAIRIEGVSKQIHDDLHNIAKNYGITFSQFMRPRLKDIAAQFPADMKLPQKKN